MSKKKKVNKLEVASGVAFGLSVASAGLSWIVSRQQQKADIEEAVEKYCKRNGWRIYKG